MDILESFWQNNISMIINNSLSEFYNLSNYLKKKINVLNFEKRKIIVSRLLLAFQRNQTLSDFYNPVWIDDIIPEIEELIYKYTNDLLEKIEINSNRIVLETQ